MATAAKSNQLKQLLEENDISNDYPELKKIGIDNLYVLNLSITDTKTNNKPQILYPQFLVT